VPPGVALLNYISSGILWRIFAKLGHFAGFSLYISNNAVRISAAAMGKLEEKEKNERIRTYAGSHRYIS
jgi:hypothetical protein